MKTYGKKNLTNDKSAKKPTYKKQWFWIIIILALLIGIGDSSETKLEDNQTDTKENISQEEKATEKVVENDLDIILRSNHPKYYGSTEDAHNTWDDVGGKKIIFADGYDKYSDDTIISMEGYRIQENNEIIRSYSFYFRNMKDSGDIKLDKALEIADTYIPYDIIDSWYEFNNSFCLEPKDNQDEDTCYVVEYHLTDKGSEEYYDGTHPYSGTIDLIFYMDTKTENIKTLSIGFGTPKWMGFLDTNGYEKIEWNYDFLAKDN